MLPINMAIPLKTNNRLIMKEATSLFILRCGLVATCCNSCGGKCRFERRDFAGLLVCKVISGAILISLTERKMKDERATMWFMCLYFHYSLRFVLRATDLPLQFHRADWRPSSLRPAQEALAVRASARCFCHGGVTVRDWFILHIENAR